MPPKKGTSTPNKPPENPTWTLDEGEEMRRDINDLQNKMVMEKMNYKRWIQWKLSWILRWMV
jgi:hypothetical protein